jgi:hypothetical protein
MSIHNASGSSVIKNNSGSAVNVAGSTVLESLGFGLESAKTGSIVVNGDDTNAALSAGVFAYNNQAPVSAKITTSLATVTNTAMLSGASVPSLTRSIHSIESIITRRQSTGFRAGNFNYFTGKYDPLPTVATDTFHKAVSGAPEIDMEANAKRSMPGGFAYKGGSVVPVMGDYPAKTA